MPSTVSSWSSVGFCLPLAVLIRFGVGLDLFINIICTICGYIPGHFHNFWIQNIRNNKNARHSPSWAVKYGLVKDYRTKRTANGWSDRYGDSATEWQNQDVIVDPLTGETRRDSESARKRATSALEATSSRPGRTMSTTAHVRNAKIPTPMRGDRMRVALGMWCAIPSRAR